MRPVDLIPQTLQAPNLERAGQQQALQPQIAQQAFAQQLRRLASERTELVQPAVEAEGARAPLVDEDERGERRAPRPPRGRPDRRRARAPEDAAGGAPGPGALLDITV